MTKVILITGDPQFKLVEHADLTLILEREVHLHECGHRN
jgi:hypothetical protein